MKSAPRLSPRVREVDGSYFGARRVRSNRGRGASGKTIVFGIFKRNNSRVRGDRAGQQSGFFAIAIRGRVAAQAVIHSDGWRGYDGLVDVSYAKHLSVNVQWQGSDEGIERGSLFEQAVVLVFDYLIAFAGAVF